MGCRGDARVKRMVGRGQQSMVPEKKVWHYVAVRWRLGLEVGSGGLVGYVSRKKGK